jgi:hypothetical protein
MGVSPMDAVRCIIDGYSGQQSNSELMLFGAESIEHGRDAHATFGHIGPGQLQYWAWQASTCNPL